MSHLYHCRDTLQLVLTSVTWRNLSYSLCDKIEMSVANELWGINFWEAAEGQYGGGGHWMDWCVVFIEWTNLTVLADCNVPRHAWLTPSVGVPDMLHFVAPYKVFRFLYLWTHNVINASVQKYNSYPVTVLVYFGTLPDAASWDKVTDTCKTQYLLLPWSHGRWRHYVLYRQMRKWILIRDTVKHHMYS